MEKAKELILALDCSLRWTNVALSRDGRILASMQLDIGRRQAAELPVLVQKLLGEAGRDWSDVGLVAVTNGPGYFTGTRIGVAYASALAYGLELQVVPVSTLAMLAFRLEERGGEVLSLVYAGRERVYASSFGSAAPLPAAEYAGEEIREWLSGHKNTRVISDDPVRIEKTVSLTRPIEKILPDAASVAQIAWNRKREALSPMALRINYHRDPDLGGAKKTEPAKR